jgi:flagellar basal body-associated protein FliL
MADEPEVGSPAADAPAGQEKPTKSSRKRLILVTAIAVLAILISAAAGNFVGKLLSAVPAAAQAKTPEEQSGDAEAPAEPEKKEETKAEGGHGGKDGAKEAAHMPGKGELGYYDMEPITVNLDEPRLARYVRASIVLAFESQDYAAACKLLDRKKPDLKSWLTIYLAGCTLEDVRGPKSLNRISREVLEAFDDQLWPDGKPKITKVLFKEFTIQ